MPSNQDDNEILKYIEEHGVEDKDVPAPRKKGKKRAVSKKSPGKKRKTVDLHGKTADQAAVILKNTFRSCKRRGFNSILIIHGKGYSSDPEEGPVLKRLVSVMLKNELREYVRDYCFALPKDGGHGATLVTLK